MLLQLRFPVQCLLTSTYGRKLRIPKSRLNTQPLISSKSTPMTMNTEETPKSKRPTCPNCSKPLTVCFCSRFKSTNLDNQVHITILQHSLENKHPLNSTRIAKIGLSNLVVVTVFDVDFEARFDVLPLEKLECPPPVCGNASMNSRIVAPLFSISIGRYGKISSIDGSCMGQDEMKGTEFEEMVGSSVSQEVMEKGFVVKKWRRPKEGGSVECEEFEITIPPGTAVLFPGENSVGVEEVGFGVKNLIVLDGTWSKANRMYNENPWLRLLPCVRLDIEKASLYSEVRVQPKAGYLSTLESIVYALKVVGEETSVLEGLENLLDVFESMVKDQRRCKDERLAEEKSLSL